MDDVLTTGSTIRTIASTLCKRYASVDICAFCLVPTEGYVGNLERGLLFGEHPGWDTQRGWVAREEDVGYGTEWFRWLGVCLIRCSVMRGLGWLGVECAVAQKPAYLIEAGLNILDT